MARNRMLSPEFWLDDELAAKTPYARLLYQGLWGLCDDNHATLPYNSLKIHAQIFPYEPSLNTRRLLYELAETAHVVFFEGEDGKIFIHLPKFFKHQRIDRPSAAKYPAFDKDSKLSDFSFLGEDSVRTRPKEKLKEVKLSKVKRKEITSSLRSDVVEETSTNQAKNSDPILDYFNRKTGQTLKLTPKKKQQLAARRKVFSDEEIKRAIDKRLEDPWYMGENDNQKVWAYDWDSLFRNDEKVENALNRDNRMKKGFSEDEARKRIANF